VIKLYRQFDLFFQLLFLLVLSAILVYYTPASINRIIFLLFFIPVWYSKKDFFWFAFVLILIEAPGGLFSGGLVGDQYRLPIYNLFPKVSFSFQEVYLVIILLKGIIKKQGFSYRSFTYRNQYSVLGILLVSLLIVSLLLGISLSSMRNVYKTMISISLYISTLFVFKNEEDIINFFKTIFPFAFLAIILQLYGMLNQQQLVAVFNPLISTPQGVLTGDEMRPIELAVVVLFCFFGSLLYLGDKRKTFSDKYLLFVNIISYISILLTATRSWFLGFTIIYLFYFYLNLKGLGNKVTSFVTAIGFFLIIIFMIPQIRNQINVASKRLLTIEQLASGDQTAGGTLNRITVRGPRVMDGFKNSTIILGAGFSDLYYEYTDGHVGFQNILLNSGVIGFVVLFSFATTLFFTPLRILKKLNYRSDLSHILRNTPLLVPAVLTINSGTQFWGFGVGEMQRVMLLAFYISVSNIYIKACKNQSYALE